MLDPFRYALVRAGVVLAMLLLAGCTDDPPPTQPGVTHRAVSGEWSYTASEVRLADSGGDAACEITGMVLHIEQLRHRGVRVGTLEGRTSGGTLTCRGELSVFNGLLTSYPLGNGYTFNHHISFDLGTPDWRHEASLTGDSAMSGDFRLRNGSLQLQGRFVARRVRP